jgi:hypothetical protein
MYFINQNTDYFLSKIVAFESEDSQRPVELGKIRLDYQAAC